MDLTSLLIVIKMLMVMLRIMIVTIKIIRTIWINNNNNHNIKNRIVQNNEKVSKTTTLILTKATLKKKKGKALVSFSINRQVDILGEKASAVKPCKDHLLKLSILHGMCFLLAVLFATEGAGSPNELRLL